ncbi:hypothetical protein NLM24_39065 [Nocardia zapadnayensis]|nr:hypothetical protein [Nocardia zapadnayensis]MCX0276536.1 hypothetical protein [Nocardia zapadnayensis]
MSKHLVAAGRLLDVDPEAAYQHAKFALNRAGRIGAVREAMGLVAYQLEKYDEAVRELRTHRRITGSTDNLALLADAERGRGKPDKALELVDEVDPTTVPPELYTELMIVAAGAHTDKGHVRAARALLEKQSFTGNASGATVRLMSAYADILRIDGDPETADKYEELARRTAKATNTFFGDEEPDPNADVEIFTIEEIEDEPVVPDTAESTVAAESTDTAVESGTAADSDTGAGAGTAQITDPDTEPGAAADTAESATAATEDIPATGAAPSAQPTAEADGPEPPSAEFDPDSAPRSFQEEIEAEVDEILAEAGFDDDAAPAGTEPIPSDSEAEALAEGSAPHETAPEAPSEAPAEVADEAAAGSADTGTDTTAEADSENDTDATTSAETGSEKDTDTVTSADTGSEKDTDGETDTDEDRRRRTDDDEEMTAPLFDL